LPSFTEECVSDNGHYAHQQEIGHQKIRHVFCIYILKIAYIEQEKNAELAEQNNDPRDGKK
jgi:hypothetical protein